MRHSPIILVALMAAPVAASAQEPVFPTSDDVAAQALAGGIVAVVGSFGMAILGARVLGPQGGEDPGLEGAIYGFGSGLVLGSAIGVHVAARGRGLDASFMTSLGGSLLGFMALWPLGALLHFDVDNGPTWIAVFAAPVAGAVAMTTLVARASARRRSRVETSLGPIPGGARLAVRIGF